MIAIECWIARHRHELNDGFLTACIVVTADSGYAVFIREYSGLAPQNSASPVEWPSPSGRWRQLGTLIYPRSASFSGATSGSARSRPVRSSSSFCLRSASDLDRWARRTSTSVSSGRRCSMGATTASGHKQQRLLVASNVCSSANSGRVRLCSSRPAAHRQRQDHAAGIAPPHRFSTGSAAGRRPRAPSSRRR